MGFIKTFYSPFPEFAVGNLFPSILPLILLIMINAVPVAYCTGNGKQSRIVVFPKTKHSTITIRKNQEKGWTKFV